MNGLVFTNHLFTTNRIAPLTYSPLTFLVDGDEVAVIEPILLRNPVVPRTAVALVTLGEQDRIVDVLGDEEPSAWLDPDIRPLSLARSTPKSGSAISPTEATRSDIRLPVFSPSGIIKASGSLSMWSSFEGFPTGQQDSFGGMNGRERRNGKSGDSRLLAPSQASACEGLLPRKAQRTGRAVRRKGLPGSGYGADLTVCCLRVGILEDSIDHRKNDGASRRTLGVVECRRQCVSAAGCNSHDRADISRREACARLIVHIGNNRGKHIGVPRELQELTPLSERAARHTGDRRRPKGHACPVHLGFGGSHDSSLSFDYGLSSYALQPSTR